MPKTDAQYEAEYDADTLMNAELIKKDKARLQKARAVLKKRAAATQAAAKG